MDINEIRSSGLLELYVIGQLSPAEVAEVEGYLRTYPSLWQDVREIERATEIYSKMTAIQAPAHLKAKIMDEVRSDFRTDSTPNSNSGWKWGTLLLGLLAMVLGYFWLQRDKEANELNEQLQLVRDTCATNERTLNQRLDLLQQLTVPANTIIPFSATPGFAATDLYLHINPETRRVFIQVRELPAIAGDQDFQLWSLKPNEAPAPLNVFDAPADGLIEVQYVEGTDAYAITIEPAGGSASPTLEHLIGTVGVSSISE